VRPQPAPADGALLFSRRQTAAKLGGVCIRTVMRLEAAGKLTPLRMNDGLSARVYHNVEQVTALAQGGR
jgi:hypothetical protein